MDKIVSMINWFNIIERQSIFQETGNYDIHLPKLVTFSRIAIQINLLHPLIRLQ